MYGNVSSFCVAEDGCIPTCVQKTVGALFPEPRADVRTDLREPHGALSGKILRPPPPSRPFGAALSRMKELVGRNETPAPLTSELRYHFLAPEGIQTPEEFLQACKGRGAEL